DGFVVNTILKEADLFCPNSVRINFTIYHQDKQKHWYLTVHVLDESGSIRYRKLPMTYKKSIVF
ncbi:hypothetical protein, partial [Levilactobacillus brevis]|uniref:hypothetical protein n=1 Tax=Levilactobacillus brevis TaxID=1580 RepID=UPI0021A3D876